VFLMDTALRLLSSSSCGKYLVTDRETLPFVALITTADVCITSLP